MSYDEKKLISFKDAIFKKVYEQTEQLKEKILKFEEEEFKKEIEQIKNESLKKLEEKIKNLKSDYKFKISKKSFEVKQEILRKRNNLVEQLIKMCEKNIKDFSKTKEYKTYLIKKIQTCLEKNSCTNSLIKIKKEDLELKEEILTIQNVKKVEPDRKIVLGGFKIIDFEKYVEVDETFDTALEESIKNFYKTTELNLKNFWNRVK